MKWLIVISLIAVAVCAETEFAYWYTNNYGDYTEEQILASVDYVQRWEIKIGADPARPGKFVVWYFGHTPDSFIVPCAKFYVDSLDEIYPTPSEYNIEEGE